MQNQLQFLKSKFAEDLKQLVLNSDELSSLQKGYLIGKAGTFLEGMYEETKPELITYELIQSKMVERGIKENSAETYMNNFKRYIKGQFNSEIPTTDVLLNADTLYEFVNKDEFTMNNKKSIFQGSVKCLEIAGLDVSCFSKRLDQIRRLVDTNTAYAKPKETTMTWAQLNGRREYWKTQVEKQQYKQDSEEYLYYVISCIWTLAPPLRSQEWVNTTYTCYELDENDKRIHSKDQSPNHFDVFTGILTISDYKTASTYGNVQKQIPKELQNILANYRKLHNGTLVLPNRKNNGKAFTQSHFSKICHKVFGPSVAPSQIRNIYVSEKVHDENMSAQKRKELSTFMSHSLSTQQLTYGKHSKMVKED